MPSEAPDSIDAARATLPDARDPSLTPAMRQYIEQKAAAPDAVLLFRIGDFYETFYDDAKLISRVLGLALTSRDKGAANPVPLAGVPHHAVNTYVARLVRAGYKVAISEQVEDPQTAKGVVRREVVRIITPGTLTDEALLEQTRENWLAAVAVESSKRRGGGESRGVAVRAGAPGRVGLACVELASGRFHAQMVAPEALLDELARLRPAEVLMPERPIDEPDALADRIREAVGAAVTTRPPHTFDAHAAERTLCEQFGVASVQGFGFDEFDASLRAAGAIVAFLRETQKTAVGHLLRIEPRHSDDHLAIDQATLRSLEVERTIRDGEREGTLLWAVDRTVNPMGARRLRGWLCYPLCRADEIRRRHEAIATLRADRLRLAKLRETLRGIGDVERITARLGVSRASPRDLAALGGSLQRLAELRSALAVGEPSAPSAASVDALRLVAGDDLLAALTVHLSGLDELAAFLVAAIIPDAPPVARDGGFIAAGLDAELDRLRSLTRDGQHWLAEYQAAEATRTGISSLKVGYNSVFGYYIEITHSHRDKVPPNYVRKQTVRNAERYITDELKRHENEVLSAEQRAVALELELFQRICDRARAEMPRLRQAAEAVATLDVLAGLAELSMQQGYCRPQLVPAGEGKRGACVLEIEDGRHPVLEQTLGPKFVPNDCRLSPDGDRVLVITGPNMAGKSTYIRQVALLTLLAQAGSWVPARTMRFTPADRLFARVGASDELARGQSTFMVEMLETARILHNASAASVVILDEIGRGTSTFDGLALAWAITEHLVTRIGCRTLFATHYHELTELAADRKGLANFNVAVREQRRPEGGDEVVFLHRIVPGGTDKSYGIHVARMAGVPVSVVARATAVLAELEQSFADESRRVSSSGDAGAASQALLFPPTPPPPAWWQALADEVAKVDLNHLTPIEALTILRDVQSQLRERGKPK